jgi:ribonuclease Z
LSFQLKILGSNSAAFAHNRHHTSQILTVQSEYFMIDCGEGTQIQLSRYKVKASKINHIFISHLHGDHYLGLMGLISTMHLRGRQNDLHIYGPKGLDEIITVQLKYSGMLLQFRLHFHLVNPEQSELLLDHEMITVKSIPLNHRIPCAGFLFQEKPKPWRINKDALPEDILLQHIVKLKKGEDVYDEDGTLLYKNEDYTFPPKKSRSYAFCSDTKYDERILEHIQGVDLLYHEATFMSDREKRAAETHHSTARQAATMAKKAKAEMLVIGHFSIRYKDITPLLTEAREVFKDTMLAIEGETIFVQD